MYKLLVCASLLVVFSSTISMANSQETKSGIKSGKYEVVAKGHVDLHELQFEEDVYVRNTGTKILSILFGLNMDEKISCLRDDCDFFLKCFNNEVEIESFLVCSFNTKEFFEKEDWNMSFTNDGDNSYTVQINEDSQTDEPFKINVVSSGTRNNAQFWICSSKEFECPLMIGDPAGLNVDFNVSGDYYIFIPRDKMVFFYILSMTSSYENNGTNIFDNISKTLKKLSVQ